MHESRFNPSPEGCFQVHQWYKTLPVLLPVITTSLGLRSSGDVTVGTLSVNKDPLLFSCTSPFYTAQVRHVHVQKEQVFLIKLKYVGCSQPLWHGFLRAASAASSWPYITASLIIAACVYLRSYCSFYIRKEFWAVRWPHTALVFFVFCHTGTAHLYLVQERLLILLAL